MRERQTQKATPNSRERPARPKHTRPNRYSPSHSKFSSPDNISLISKNVRCPKCRREMILRTKEREVRIYYCRACRRGLRVVDDYFYHTYWI